MQFDLVFEGGGAKGMSFVGALQELEARGHSAGRLLGTSAGAIAAIFTAAGYSVTEMLEALSEKDESGRPVFASFLSSPRPFTRPEIDASLTKQLLKNVDFTILPDFIEDRLDDMVLSLMTREAFGNLFSLIERGGWYGADVFLEWVQTKLDSGDNDGRPRRYSHMTFLEFYLATGKEVTLVAADTTARQLLVLNHNTAPHCPVAYGMRMSMSLPFLWEEVVWDRSWGPYLGTNITGHRAVDGGLLSNFPIELFLSRDPHVVALMGEPTEDGVLGLLIDETRAVPGAEDPAPKALQQVAPISLLARLRALVDTATQAHDKMVIDAFESFVCRLPARGYETTDFDMSDERRELLIRAGRQATAEHFDDMALESIAVDTAALEYAGLQADSWARSMLTPFDYDAPDS